MSRIGISSPHNENVTVTCGFRRKVERLLAIGRGDDTTNPPKGGLSKRVPHSVDCRSFERQVGASPAIAAVAAHAAEQAADAANADRIDKDDKYKNISAAELAGLRMKIASATEGDHYKQRVRARLASGGWRLGVCGGGGASDAEHSDERGGGGGRGDDGGDMASASTVARLEGNVCALGDQLTMTQKSIETTRCELQASIGELGAQMTEMFDLLRAQKSSIGVVD